MTKVPASRSGPLFHSENSEMVGYHPVKRMLDILVALIALVVLSPLIVVIGVLVLLFLGSPVFFTQKRVTKDERVFRLWKFRSMRNAAPERGLVSDSQRMTRFGRLLRSSSLDELPSLWNILLGDMSLIGPRPLPIRYLPHYSDEQRRRHQVRGGLSGLAQVSGRNRVCWDDRFDLDVEYVNTVSLWLDLRILIRTVAIVFRADGISQDGEVTADNFGGTLKSDLLVFDQLTRTESVRTWAVSSTAREELGCGEISAMNEDAVLIRFDAASEAAGNIDIRREVVRLLTNRARATEAVFAVWALPSGSEDRAILAEAGFRELSGPDEPLRFGHNPSTDTALTVCRLWPEAGLGTDTARNSIPSDCRQTDIHHGLGTETRLPTAEAGRWQAPGMTETGR
ncbi:MAG: sugar transferase [Brevibacterium sp.]|nr:sugar transferase [Brevibacterium sp.]